MQILSENARVFDLIFNDINKEDYTDSLPVIAGELRPGGMHIVDNMFWHGRIFVSQDKTPTTESIR